MEYKVRNIRFLLNAVRMHNCSYTQLTKHAIFDWQEYRRRISDLLGDQPASQSRQQTQTKINNVRTPESNKHFRRAAVSGHTTTVCVLYADWARFYILADLQWLHESAMTSVTVCDWFMAKSPLFNLFLFYFCLERVVVSRRPCPW